jgi:hypothetical protein
MSLRLAVVRVLRDLNDLGIGHAVIGGLAVSARVEPRMTRDVDVAIAAADDRAAEDVVHRLLALGYVVDAVLEQSAAGRLATTRLLPPSLADSGVVIDLLFASSGIEREVVDAAEPLQILTDAVAPVATVGHLLALKLLSVSEQRPQDAADLERLSAIASPDDVAQARIAVRQIVERGFGRGRDLETALQRLTARITTP